MKQLISLFAVATVAALMSYGCGSADVQVSKQEEQQFRNEPKEPPPAAVEGMKEAMSKVPGNTGKK